MKNKYSKGNYWYKSGEILKLFPKPNFKSWECGFNSTEKKNIKRVVDVVDKLHELNRGNIKDSSVEFFDMIKGSIIDYMEESGYKHSINARDKTQFKKVV